MTTALDLLAGCALLLSGALAWRQPPGPLFVLAGVAWLAGDVWSWALHAHRGPLVQLVLAYPRARPGSRLAGAVCAAAYVDGLVPALARDDALTVALACAVIALAARREQRGGAERRARRVALAAAGVVCGLPALGAPRAPARRRRRQHRPRCLRGGDRVRGRRAARRPAARALGPVGGHGSAARPRRARTPGLAARDARAFAGRPHAGRRLPRGTAASTRTAARSVPAPGRAVTRFGDAVLVHDDVVLRRPGVRRRRGAARCGSRSPTRGCRRRHWRACARIQRSRRRLIEAGDAQRARLQRELRDGAERHLAAAAARLDAWTARPSSASRVARRPR